MVKILKKLSKFLDGLASFFDRSEQSVTKVKNVTPQDLRDQELQNLQIEMEILKNFEEHKDRYLLEIRDLILPVIREMVNTKSYHRFDGGFPRNSDKKVVRLVTYGNDRTYKVVGIPPYIPGNHLLLHYKEIAFLVEQDLVDVDGWDKVEVKLGSDVEGIRVEATLYYTVPRTHI